MVAVSGLITIPAGAPAISISVPRFVPLATKGITEVPILVILPLASGVPAVGLTRTFCQVSVFLVWPFDLETTVNMISVEFMEVIFSAVLFAASLMFLFAFVLVLVRNTVTVAEVSNSKPAGAAIITVPVPMSATVVSTRAGPVRAV